MQIFKNYEMNNIIKINSLYEFY